jgi:glycosyltransferase involved in cell wall biosynthesis
MDISVVIPVLDMADTIGEQLEALCAQDFDGEFEVLVVDNGSTDRTVAVVRDFAGRDSRIRLIDGSAIPHCAGAARNLGIEIASASLIAFCDADDVVHSSWLRLVYEGLLNAPAVSTVLEHWTLNPHVLRSATRQCTGRYDVLGFPGLPGGACGMRRDVYRSLGGFDVSVRGADDSEFAVRLGLAGHKVKHLDDAVVSVRSRTGARANFRRAYLLHRSIFEIRDRHNRPRLSFLRRAWILLRRTQRLVSTAALLFDERGRNAWCERAGMAWAELEDLVRHPTSSSPSVLGHFHAR